jgi:hypothetical protein
MPAGCIMSSFQPVVAVCFLWSLEGSCKGGVGKLFLTIISDIVIALKVRQSSGRITHTHLTRIYVLCHLTNKQFFRYVMSRIKNICELLNSPQCL